MAIEIFNTMGGRKQPLEPFEPPRIEFFVCGPTVYDFSHLGHAKTYTQFDFIARYLRYRGFDVFYLQNITDIDDKIIRRAGERGVAPEALAAEFEQHYREDMEALGNTSVTQYARAHDFIDQIVDQIHRLRDKGFSYEIPGDGIYYDIDAFAGYGKLSGRSELAADDAVSRIDENPDKRNPGDFCLWKARKEGEPYWSTELGDGRPGWHIEDTAITEHYFGPQYDIHGGAVDLIFPHHEAEIAQIEAASGLDPMVRCWMHTGFLNMKGEKMSKSLGNFVTIRNALERLDYRILRFYFLRTHYRSPADMTDDGIDQARQSLERLQNFVRNVDRERDDADSSAAIDEFKAAFHRSLDDDFNTPKALGLLFDFVRDRNRAGNAGRRVFQLLQEVDRLFDVFDFKTDAEDDGIQQQVDLRQRLRAEKKFAEADQIRDRLLDEGIVIEDSPAGPRWHRK
ncbi:MAG: cysteine--tRNA ligase [Thermoanaerobaculia bacterium]